MQGVGYKEKMLSNVCEKREATHSNFHSTRKKNKGAHFYKAAFQLWPFVSGRGILELNIV